MGEWLTTHVVGWTVTRRCDLRGWSVEAAAKSKLGGGRRAAVSLAKGGSLVSSGCVLPNQSEIKLVAQSGGEKGKTMLLADLNGLWPN